MVENPWASALKVALVPLWGVGSIPTAIWVYFHSLTDEHLHPFYERKHLVADLTALCFDIWSSLSSTYLISADWE